ncbi:DotA/TraY family protein [Tritonibacter mobilis]|uniref:DotA/TraY family protein n=1 Tax=Tritonibacter mobilis TaxID=379347 RepID=UPI0013B3F7EE|nr:DotA/TraY family protein [Tritonibacter mobilis]
MSKTSILDGNILNRDTAKAVWRYATRPEIIPRLRALGFHFGHFAYLLALVLNSARLIPTGHIVLNPASIGRFGVRQVIAIAANHITWSWKNIDQIAIFGAVIIGILMIVVQLFVIAAMVLVGPAQASPSFFETPVANVPTDVVLKMLEQVFGPNLNIFGAASQQIGTPVFLGLQAILGFYSQAMMVIAVIIVLYYIMTVIGEAAKTGTPFGQRFNSLWAPLRLVIALGLLVPLGSGLNSAQYATLWIAKMGSGFGTQVWSVFIDEFTAPTEIIAPPPTATTVELVRRIFLSEVCAAAYNQINEGTGNQVQILQELGRSSEVPNFASVPDMIAAAGIAGESGVVLSWDSAEPGEDADSRICGYVSISLTEFDEAPNDSAPGFAGQDIRTRLNTIHQDMKAEYIRQIDAIAQAVRPAAELVAAYHVSVNARPTIGNDSSLNGVPAILQAAANTSSAALAVPIQTSYTQLTGATYGNATSMKVQGWGAAGMWFSNIGKINQRYMDAMSSGVPTFGDVVDSDDPDEQVRNGLMRFFGFRNFGMGSGPASEIENAILYAEDEFAEHMVPSALYAATPLDAADEEAQGKISRLALSIFGAGPLADMKDNPSLDPMAKMTSAGHNMINSSLVAFGVGTLAAALSFVPKISAIASAVKHIAFAIGAIGLLAGVMLAYILPLIPFIYFTFAVLGWVLEIFEAVIAMPIWALSHLRIDGDGMPGSTAIHGYHLLLMILLRPALIVAGLIGGSVIFGAAMFFMTTMFNSAVSITRDELVGGETGFLGIIVYTVIFTFLAYNIALMCFKMVDDVPKGMLRWLGSGAQPFSDSRGDPINGSREVMAGAIGAGVALSNGFGKAIDGFGRQPPSTSGGVTGGNSTPPPSGGTGGFTTGGPNPNGPVSPSHQLGGPIGGGGPTGAPGGGSPVPPSRQLGGSGGASSMGAGSSAQVNPHQAGTKLHKLWNVMNDPRTDPGLRSNAKEQYDRKLKRDGG